MHKPFEAHNPAEFTMLPQGNTTKVTWVMHGPAPFRSKVMQVFMDFDRMIGKDVDAGLANLKTLSKISRPPRHHPPGVKAMISTYLHFNGDCEAAFKFYEKELGAKIEMLLRYADAPPEMPSSPSFKDKI